MDNIVYICAGSNQGDREHFLRFAICELAKDDKIKVMKVSSIYETEPVDYLDQPMFLNLVIQLKTAYKPTKLLQVTQNIEKKAKRNRTIRFGPRTLDLDILLYNQENIKLSHLEIPHPRMKERAFVIIPLMEIAPFLVLPDDQRVCDIYDDLSGKEGVSLWKTRINWGEEFEPFEN